MDATLGRVSCEAGPAQILLWVVPWWSMGTGKGTRPWWCVVSCPLLVGEVLPVLKGSSRNKNTSIEKWLFDEALIAKWNCYFAVMRAVHLTPPMDCSRKE
jgi:hypothetical protein